jgi:glycolate oxidase FAD binding subunit
VAFKGGGRVVKNVAGYDFCKLLTGSLGTLAVITQLALKVKPLPEQSATVVAECADLDAVEAVLERLSQLEAPPVAIEVLTGRAWRQFWKVGPAVVVRVEGSEVEVNWLVEQVQQAAASGGAQTVSRLQDEEAARLWAHLVEFSDRGMPDAADSSPLVLKIAVPSSAVTDTVGKVLVHDADCDIQAHAGNGIVYARFTRFSHTDLTSMLIGKLRPGALRLGGSAIVVSSKMEGLTPHMVWGGRTEGDILLERIKQQFDPHEILNPGRFIF